MREIRIEPRRKFLVPVEAEGISPDVLAPLTLEEIGRIEVWEGNRRSVLSDLFALSGDDVPGEAADARILLSGDFSRVKRIGEKMTSGMIEAGGDVGMHAGNGMAGGEIEIAGRAGDWLGREMRGGKINVSGDAGDYVGAGYRGESCGMRGGEIRIEGSAGDYLGEHLCGGKITVLGDAGDFPGIANRGGVIVIGGNAHLPGAEMASGAITVFGRARVLPSYQRQETVEIDGQSLKKFLGDLVDGGKGELYVASMEA
ncbi:MAG: Tungsten-containing formylmethanofuran dehydrogenase 2 subunit C [Methanosaeta sp. PtaU1.Bin055]|nr:MAG: Tungsten-containing formylmethanofuran dehydrogenase 2 subunit C [Methanosaeta sp. PtaU1.Bin055]